jgi:SLAP domain-containing protein
MKAIRIFNVLLLMILLLTGCSDKQDNFSNKENDQSGARVDQKAQQKLSQYQDNGTSIKAKLVILDNQPHFTKPEAKKLLDTFMEKNPTIEAGKVDVILAGATYDGENLATLILIRNGMDKTITAKDLDDATITINGLYNEKIAEGPLAIIPEHLGKLKTGEVRALRFDFTKEQISIKDYDFTKGATASLSGL